MVGVIDFHCQFIVENEPQESVTFLVIGKEQTLSKESRNDEVLVPKWLCSMTEALCHTHGGSDDDLVD